MALTRRRSTLIHGTTSRGITMIEIMVTIAVMVGTSPGIASGNDLKAQQAHQQNGRRHPETLH